MKLVSSSKSDPFKLDVNVSDEKDVVRVKSSSSTKASLWAHLPILFSVAAEAEGDSNVTIADVVESEFCTLRTEQGDISATDVKTGAFSAETTHGGDVFLQGHIQGAVTISTALDGDVVSELRITGPSLDVRTENGDIRVASSYAEEANFSTAHGDVVLRNLHNESNVAVYEKGNVHVQGLDGCTNIFVKDGDVDAHLSRVSSESRIHAENGDIRLRIDEKHPIKIVIDADDVVPDAKFGKLGRVETTDGGDTRRKHFSCAIEPDKFSPTVVVIAENGSVVLECLDWASSLNLKV